MEAEITIRRPSAAGKIFSRIGAVLACLPHAVMMGLGLFGLIFGALRLTWGSALLFFLAPGLSLWLSVRMLRKPLHIAGKIVQTLLLWGLLVFAVWSAAFWTFFLPLETHSVSREKAAETFAAQHPHLDLIQNLELGEAEEITYHDCFRLSGLFFDTQVDALVCRYGEDYEAQKAELEAQLPFWADPLESGDPDTGERLRFEPNIRIGDDLFRFLDPGENYKTWFGKFCVLFVSNDKTRELAFLIYDDIEVDSVTDIEKFIEHDCCWAMIR